MEKNNPTINAMKMPMADMVAYGAIYTAEDAMPQAAAFAVKDGKYIYVGDEEGARAYVGEGTKVIDLSGKGMVTPGFGDCHAHYLMAAAMGTMGCLMVNPEFRPAEFLEEVAKAYAQAKAEGKPSIYSFGWTYQYFEDNMPTVEQLDAVCPDIPLFAHDSEGHKGLANSLCMRRAGIIDAEGKLIIDQIQGGEIVVDADGKPTGLFKEQASTYCRLRGIDYDSLLDDEKAIAAVSHVRDGLLSKGIVTYMDGWSNCMGIMRLYDAAKALDDKGELNLNLGMAYEIESSTKNLDGDLSKAFATKEYSTSHINPHFVKLFIDGTVESGTGYVRLPYPDGSKGLVNWTPSAFADVTARANAQDYTIHVHTMGDEAVHLAVSGFASAGRKEMRNTLVHVRNVIAEDYDVMAANDIVCAAGILWHRAADFVREYLLKALPEQYALEMYPMKSFCDHGVTMTSHSDYPATSGSSELPFFIMQNAVTCEDPITPDTLCWPEEAITRQQALKVLTINAAYQMHSEKERGSIAVGKYADFVIADKDVMNEACPVTDIHTANVIGTFFEGKQVYEMK